MNKNKRIIGCVTVGLIVLVIVGIILVAQSLRGIHYYEYGFVRTTTTGEVDTSKVYEFGLHPVGPTKEFITFQADAHFLHLESLSCGTKSGNEVDITLDIQYLLSRDELKDLYEEYNEDYEDIIKASATEAIKQTTVQFENLEFMRKRELIELTLYEAVKSRIHDHCCPGHCETDVEGEFCVGCIERSNCRTRDKGLYVRIYRLQLGEIFVPEDLRGRLLKALLQQIRTQEASLSKNVTIVAQETQVLVNVINNEANEISANASAEAGLIIGKAEAEARSLVEQARIDSLTMVLRTLNLTQPQEISYFNYYTNLNRLNNKHISINFDHNIVGN